MNSENRDVIKTCVQVEKNGRKVMQSKNKLFIPVSNILPSKMTLKNVNYFSWQNNENVCQSSIKFVSETKVREPQAEPVIQNNESKASRGPFKDLPVNTRNVAGNVSTIKRSPQIVKQQFPASVGSAKLIIQSRKRSKSSTDEETSKVAKRYHRSKSVTDELAVYKDGSLSPPAAFRAKKNTIKESKLNRAYCANRDTIKCLQVNIAFCAERNIIKEGDLNTGFCAESNTTEELQPRERHPTNFNVCRSLQSKSNQFAFNISPIKPNALTKPDTLITEQLFESRRKPKIKKSFAVNYSALDNSSILPGSICVHEYLEDMLRHSLYLEDGQILESGFLFLHNPVLPYRTKCVNWIFKIQDVMKLPDNEIYMSIYVFDKTLATLPVPVNMYQLVAITSIWIANKMENINSVQASNLLSVCGNSFTQGQMCGMEQKILKIMNFKLCIPEPTFFVMCGLKLLELENNEFARHCAHFVVDCFALHADFSSTPKSTMSFGAINIALKRFHNKKSNFYDSVKIFGSDVPDLDDMENRLEKQMIIIKSSPNINEQLKRKYTNVERMNVFQRM